MATIQFKRGLASGIPTLASGEPGWTTDTNVLYVGTGAGNVLIGPGGGATSPLTTKGDLWGYTTADARVPVGTNGQVLTADSTAAAGVSWQAPASGLTLSQGTIAGRASATGSGPPVEVSLSYPLQMTAGSPILLVRYAHSVVAVGSPVSLQLDGDAATPGNAKFYGTSGAGAKGWQDFAAAVTASGLAIASTTGTLATGRGGTGLTTYAAGDVVYASAANTLAALAVGTAGQVLTVVSGAPAWAAPPTNATATSGGSSLGSDYTFTSTSYGDSGLSITLPAAGTYLIVGTFNFRCQVSAGQGAIDVQLYNTTDSAAVASSDRRAGACTGQDLANWSSSGAVWLVTVAASKTIRLEAKRVALSSPTWVASVLVGTYTLLSYVKLST